LRVGLGGDIASGGGSLGGWPTRSLADLFNNFNDTTRTSPDLLAFDISFARAIPELRQEFSVPHFFRSFSNDLACATNESWFFLSIGGSRRGLPFHVHGESWLGLTSGRKRWYLYPPSGGSLHSPVADVYMWVYDVYPRLPPEERPLECTQEVGDLMYLPRGWKHLTMNLGDTIGVGGQAIYSSRARLIDG